jgi:hypothetical protein
MTNEEKSFKLYVTYGNGSNLRNNYSVVTGVDYADCRAQVMEVTGGKFAFDYTEAEFKHQPAQYNLTEVPLQPQVLS